MANFKSLFDLIANIWAKLHTLEYRLFENGRAHFAWRVNQALIFTIYTFSNNLVFDMLWSQPLTFYNIRNFDSGCSWLKEVEHNLRSTFFLDHSVYIYILFHGFTTNSNNFYAEMSFLIEKKEKIALYFSRMTQFDFHV